MVTEEALTLCGEHTIHYVDDVLKNCILEAYIILLTNVTPINSIHFLKIKKLTINLKKQLSSSC